MITGNEPAMPTTSKEFLHHSDYDATLGSFGGLTIRQHFSSMAMIGLVSQQAPVDRVINEQNQSLTKQLAEASVILADALINELNKTPQP